MAHEGRWFSYWKWGYSIVMLVYQRVYAYCLLMSGSLYFLHKMVGFSSHRHAITAPRLPHPPYPPTNRLCAIDSMAAVWKTLQPAVWWFFLKDFGARHGTSNFWRQIFFGMIVFQMIVWWLWMVGGDLLLSFWACFFWMAPFCKCVHFKFTCKLFSWSSLYMVENGLRQRCFFFNIPSEWKALLRRCIHSQSLYYTEYSRMGWKKIGGAHGLCFYQWGSLKISPPGLMEGVAAVQPVTAVAPWSHQRWRQRF